MSHKPIKLRNRRDWNDERYKELVELYIGYLSIFNKGSANRIVGDIIEEEAKPPFKRSLLASKVLLDIHRDRRQRDVIDKTGKCLSNTMVDQPSFWNERKWKCPNSPVVGVSWYEAYAFTRWLTVKLNDKYVYRLLTENEWEAAASGREGREYPWGNVWDKNRCNNGEIKIKKTSPVGIFKNGNTPRLLRSHPSLEGNTPSEIADLSGNVREWTLSDYHSGKNLEDFIFDEEVFHLFGK